jgi:WD repeat and SOF domain-containing protein 1
MRVGAGLDNGKRMRRGSTEPYHYLFREAAPTETHPLKAAMNGLGHPVGKVLWTTSDESVSDNILRQSGTEIVDLQSRPTMHANVITPSNQSAVDLCDPERPRIFHVYWSGAFTDKPYLMLASYLYTQSLDLHIPVNSQRPADRTSPCRPQFWVWINPGVYASVPNPNAKRQMFDTLAVNPWSAPFLHPRFHDVIKFKLWNTTEMFDFHPELAGWRQHNILGKQQVEPDEALKLEEASDLVSKYKEDEDKEGADGVPRVDKEYQAAMAAMAELNKSDPAQVIMSDIARFVVTHRYGGLYLDVDNVFLRDFEELWNWRGAFAMRWSHHLVSNTAILRMHQNSALGSFLMRTAMRSKYLEPFHPQSITDYLDEAGMAALLFRLPDALFDPDFLNMEKQHRDRPPYPATSEDSKYELHHVVTTLNINLCACQ